MDHSFMTRQEALALVQNCKLDETLCSYNWREKVQNYLPDDFDGFCSAGASKVAIIPENSRFVIKIPFYADSIYYYDDDGEPLPEEEQEIKVFECANKDYKRYWDYCLQELLIYRKARKARLQKFFAKTALLGLVNNYPIYIQEKCTNLANYKYDYIGFNENASAEASMITSSIGDRYFDLNDYWQTRTYLYYGEKEFTRFIYFLNSFNGIINDLHSENVGFRFFSDSPVLMDYSGYHE